MVNNRANNVFNFLSVRKQLVVLVMLFAFTVSSCKNVNNEFSPGLTAMFVVALPVLLVVAISNKVTSPNKGAEKVNSEVNVAWGFIIDSAKEHLADKKYVLISDDRNKREAVIKLYKNAKEFSNLKISLKDKDSQNYFLAVEPESKDQFYADESNKLLKAIEQKIQNKLK